LLGWLGLRFFLQKPAQKAPQALLLLTVSLVALSQKVLQAALKRAANIGQEGRIGSGAFD